MNNDLKIKKIIYRAIHRGCKETDFLLGNFFEANVNNIEKLDIQACSDFLEEDDMQIYDWILNKVPINDKYKDIITAIRKFHNLI
jgi:antitoxin CptB